MSLHSSYIRRPTNTPRFLLTTFVCLLSAWPAQAGTIASVSGPSTVGLPLSGSGAHVAVSWTSSVAHSGVQISADLATFIGVGGVGNIYTGTAYLTSQIGPGTTAAHEIARTNFTFPDPPPFPGNSVTLFSGLTLGPGSYFLVLTGEDVPTCNSSTGCGLWIQTAKPATVSMGAGVSSVMEFISSGPGYAPGLAWTDQASSAYASIFDVSSVPEPSGMTLAMIGLAAVAGISYLRRSQSHRP